MARAKKSRCMEASGNGLYVRDCWVLSRMTSLLPALSIQGCNYGSAGKIEETFEHNAIFSTKTAVRGSENWGLVSISSIFPPHFRI